MVSLSFEVGEMVLVRQDDGLLWPGTIIKFDAADLVAGITFIRDPEYESSLRYSARPTGGVVKLELIYKFASNVHRLLQEARRATFSGGNRGHKLHYIRILERAIKDFEKTEDVASSSSTKTSPIAVLPVLNTPSPARIPEMVTEMPIVDPLPRPETYGSNICDALAKGFRELYFVNDLNSAKKIIYRLPSEKLPPEVGIVCEHHPQWVFAELTDCLKHWYYVHYIPGGYDDPTNDEDVPDSDQENGRGQ